MMDGQVVSGDKFPEKVAEILEEKRDLTDEALHKAVDKTAKEIVKRTKSGSPVRTGAYKKGWGSKKTTETDRGSYGRTVHNRTRYMLTHLLENGHGGRAKADPIPHIPSDDLTESILLENLEKEMR